jgi:hypothetical protein
MAGGETCARSRYVMKIYYDANNEPRRIIGHQGTLLVTPFLQGSSVCSVDYASGNSSRIAFRRRSHWFASSFALCAVR